MIAQQLSQYYCQSSQTYCCTKQNFFLSSQIHIGLIVTLPNHFGTPGQWTVFESMIFMVLRQLVGLRAEWKIHELVPSWFFSHSDRRCLIRRSIRSIIMTASCSRQDVHLARSWKVHQQQSGNFLQLDRMLNWVTSHILLLILVKASIHPFHPSCDSCRKPFTF